jgi:hypothetical protein
MTLWSRAPREVYRVYGEDEYLTEEHDAVEAVHPRTETDGLEDRQSVLAQSPSRSRSARLIGFGLLAGVTVGATGLVVSSASHRDSTPPSQILSRGAPTQIAGQAPTASFSAKGYAARTRVSGSSSQPRQLARTHRLSIGRSKTFLAVSDDRPWLEAPFPPTTNMPASPPRGEFEFER